MISWGVNKLKRGLSRLVSKKLSKFRIRILSIFLKEGIVDSLFSRYFQTSHNFITWEYFSFGANGGDVKQQQTTLDPYLQRKVNSAILQKRQLNPFGSNLAIVLQGPVISKDELTYRIAQNYIERYPDAHVILSTWVSTPTSDLKKFQRMNEIGKLKLILNEEPEFESLFNINHQISSTFAGFSYALDKYEFSIKSRSDQLFTNPLFLKNLETVWNEYGNGQGKAERIVISSLNTFAFRLYGASDMFQFGKTDTLHKFWNQKHDLRSKSSIANSSPNLFDEAQKRVAEVYLNCNYFNCVEKTDVSFSFEESLRFLSEHFIVVDQDSVSQLWFKNTNLSNRWRSQLFPNKYYEISHLDWLEMQNNLDLWMKYQNLIFDKNFYYEK